MCNISDNIRNFRRLRGMTQKELAQKLNVAVSTLSNWERGSDNFGIGTFYSMCTILNVTPNQLFGIDPSPELEKFLKEEEEQQIAKAQEILDELTLKMKAYSEKIHNMKNKE